MFRISPRARRCASWSVSIVTTQAALCPGWSCTAPVQCAGRSWATVTEPTLTSLVTSPAPVSPHHQHPPPLTPTHLMELQQREDCQALYSRPSTKCSDPQIGLVRLHNNLLNHRQVWILEYDEMLLYENILGSDSSRDNASEASSNARTATSTSADNGM